MDAHAAHRLLLALALAIWMTPALAACGGTYARPANQAAPASAEQPATAVRGVEAAGLPSRILRARGGQEVTPDTFYSELAQADAICIGEQHSNPHHHWAQLQILDQLTGRAKTGGVAVGLGLEMFQRPYQGVLDDYAAGKIDNQALIVRSGWKDRWGFDFNLYRPMLEMARDRGAAVLALNISTELRKKVSKQGVDELAEADRAKLPEVDTQDPDHRAWWDAIMAEMAEAHGGAHGHGQAEGEDAPSEEEAAAAAERMYFIQVLWDETMADTAARWLSAGDARQVVILAGNGHCHDSAIVKRLRRRGHDRVVSVRPVIETGDGELADVLADPQNDYLWVMTMPEQSASAAKR